MEMLLRVVLCLCAINVLGWSRVVVVNQYSRLPEVVIALEEGDTLSFAPGVYSAPTRMLLVFAKKVRITGEGATLQNVSLQFLADVELTGLRLVESDCSHDQTDPETCPVTGAMISLGYIGYPIRHASFRNFRLQYTRAYTGIEMGFGELADVLIEHFEIDASSLSGLSIYGGSGITIRDGTIRGRPGAVVDDGIAIASSYGPIRDVVIESVEARDTFDLLGIGTLLYYPVTDVRASQLRCNRTAACVYVKPGEKLPGGRAYSYVDGLIVDGVEDVDLTGERNAQTVLVIVRAGAAARNLQIRNIRTIGRMHSNSSMRIKVYVCGKTSSLDNLTVQDAVFADYPGESGYTAAEGAYIQVDEGALVSKITLKNVCLDGITQYAVDSWNGRVENLSVEDLKLRRFGGTDPFAVPYEFTLTPAVSGAGCS